jgi:hypothetical protein
MERAPQHATRNTQLLRVLCVVCCCCCCCWLLVAGGLLLAACCGYHCRAALLCVLCALRCCANAMSCVGAGLVPACEGSFGPHTCGCADVQVDLDRRCRRKQKHLLLPFFFLPNVLQPPFLSPPLPPPVRYIPCRSTFLRIYHGDGCAPRGDADADILVGSVG